MFISRSCRPGLSLQRISTRNVSQSSILFTQQPRNASGSSKPIKSRTKLKTTKTITDLPKAYLTPQGSPAAPLPTWFSGSDQPTEENGAVFDATSEEPKDKPKRRRSKKASDIGQDDAEAPDTFDSGSPTMSPLAQEIQTNLSRYPHCLLLTKVGQFYESYFDQAADIARILNIKFTSRKWGGGRVAMCGFPVAHLDRHLKVLVQQERRFVAMCEEFPLYANGGAKEFQRRVTRIITPGTLIDEAFLNPLDNNFLLSLSSETQDVTSASSVGLAWIDVSTGEFFSEVCTSETLEDEIARISPREIVLNTGTRGSPFHNLIASLTASMSCPISFTSVNTIPNTATPFVDLRTNPAEAQETSAISLLTTYLRENLMEHMPMLLSASHEDSTHRMQIDSHTIQSLEIRETTYEGGTKGSLLSVIKRTNTPGGSRLLARWLCESLSFHGSPSTSITEIRARQSAVSFFHERPLFKNDLIAIFRTLDDMGRLSQKFLLGRADVSDLQAIHTTINTWQRVFDLFCEEKSRESQERDPDIVSREWEQVDRLISRLAPLHELSERISKAVAFPTELPNAEDLDAEVEDSSTAAAAVLLSEPEQKWTINPTFSNVLLDLHRQLRLCCVHKQDMESSLQAQCGNDAPSLTLRSSPGQGLFVHLGKARRDRKKLDENPAFQSIGESATTKSYFYKPWSDLGIRTIELSTRRSLAEKAVFQQLRLEIVEHMDQLRQNTRILDELDVAISLAMVAQELNFVVPDILEDESYTLVSARHPVVEKGLMASGRTFTPNSLEMTPSTNFHLITGPNMGGKSTFLRQTALIAILAQVGSFVPAEYASIGIIDRLFSRIGAKDDLFRDRSTFMVEMLETADILRRATPKSLVIMDEIGRGTTMKDGLAIAYSALHHLVTVNQSRCLFATHFHELADMVGISNEMTGKGYFKSVQFYCSDLHETEDGYVAYGYHLQRGINRDSHGIKVAQLAGMPPAALKVAKSTLAELRAHPSLLPDKLLVP